jgi:hypothetical protein
MREATWSLVRTGLIAALAGDEKAMPEKPVAVKLKQCKAQAAMHAESSAVFCVLSAGAVWRWCSQSGVGADADADISVADGAVAAKPSAAGSIATDRLIRMAIMVRPMRIVILCFVRTAA